MSLTFKETFPVAFGASTVWTRLQDIEFVARCFPGATLEEQLDDGSYAGRLAMKLGPTRAQFQGTLRLELDDDERTAALAAKGGDGRRSQAAANGTIRVAEDTDTASLLRLDVTIDVAGPLGQFARSGGRELTRQLLGDFVTSVEEQLANEQSAIHSTDVEELHTRTRATPSSEPTPIPPDRAPTPPRQELDAGSLVWRSICATLARWFRSVRERWHTRRKA